MKERHDVDDRERVVVESTDQHADDGMLSVSQSMEHDLGVREVRVLDVRDGCHSRERLISIGIELSI